MTERHYYFEIPSCNVIDCVKAVSLAEAKQKAFDNYCEHWSDLRWLTTDQKEA
jgi:hypothetical protein